MCSKLGPTDNKTSSTTAIYFSSSHKVDQPLALFIPKVCAEPFHVADITFKAENQSY